MGSVHEATHHALGKRVAIKRLHPHLAANADSLARFVGEGRAIAQVRHPHVVEVFDLDEEERAPCLVMELLEGCTLAERLARGPALSVTEAVDLSLPLVSALAAAHAAGVVHRDVKPSNVFLRRGILTDPCIVDFGVSKDASRAVDELTQSGTLVGSYPYFSPEHTRGARGVTAKSDQYSLAVVLYECVSGARPFREDSVYELMHAIATRDVTPPSRVRPSIPREFDDALLKALHRDPAHRYPTMAAFGSALLGFASRRGWHVWSPELGGVGPEVGALERTTAEALEAPRPRSRRRARSLVLAPVAVALALGIGVSAKFVRSAPRELPAAAVAAAPAASTVPAAMPMPLAPPATEPPRPLAATAPVVEVPSAPVQAPRARRAPPPPVSAPKPAERGSNGVAIFD